MSEHTLFDGTTVRVPDMTEAETTIKDGFLERYVLVDLVTGEARFLHKSRSFGVSQTKIPYAWQMRAFIVVCANQIKDYVKP